MLANIKFNRIFKTFILIMFLPICFGQNVNDPEFKSESKIVQSMLSDSITIFTNDTLTIELGYYTNGSLKTKLVYYHPEGAPEERWRYEYLNFAESSYHEDGKIAAYVERYNDKLHGNYMQFDSDKFVTHWVFNNGNLVDVKNDNCRFLDQKGKIISKEEFFECYESSEYGQWGYYLFESEYEPYNQLTCVDYVMYSGNWMIPSEGKQALKLVGRLNKTCANVQ